MVLGSIALRLNQLALLAVMLCAALTCAGQAQAAPAWQNFDLARWQAMTQPAARPTVAVFTTTDCAYCPQTIHSLATQLRARGQHAAKLAIVVMDGAELTSDLAKSHHYQMADALYAFRGAEMPLRYAVDPQWRGETPYVVLIFADGSRKQYIGAPPAADLSAFLKTARR